MSKFILILETDFLLKNENWIRDQKPKYDRVLGSIEILSYGITEDFPWIEVNDLDASKFSKIDHSFFDSFDSIPDYISKVDLWNRFTYVEKLELMDASNISSVDLFLYTLRLKDVHNLKDTELIMIVEQLETDSIINPGRASEILES